MAAYVQSKSLQWFSGAGTTESFTFTSNVTAGNLICVHVGWVTTTSTLNSVKDGANNSYTIVDTWTDGTLGKSSTFYLPNVPGGSTTLTATWSADPGFGAFMGHEVSGRDTATPLDQHVNNVQVHVATTTDAVTSTAATTTANGEYIFGSSFDDTGTGGVTWTKGTGFTSTREGAAAKFYATEDLDTQGSAASIAATFTVNVTNTTPMTSMMTFKPAAALSPPAVGRMPSLRMVR